MTELRRLSEAGYRYEGTTPPPRNPPSWQPAPRVSDKMPEARGIRATPYRWPDPATLPLREWLYGTTLIRRFVSALIAPGAVGKSSYCRTMALALASGRNLLGDEPSGPAKVWIYNLEDPLEEVERGMAATAMHFDIDASQCEARLFVNSGRDQPLVLTETTRGGTKIAGPVVEALVAEMQANAIDVLIIDPFVSSHDAAENDNVAIDRVVKTWASVAHRTNASILLVHHSRKTNGNEVTIEDARGASALVGAVRSARVLNKMTAEEATKAGIEQPWAHVRVTDGKANLAPPASVARWFKLENVSLGNGTKPHEGDRVGVATPWTWPDAFEDVNVGHLRRVQDIVSKGRYRDSNQADDWVGNAVAEVLGLDLGDTAAKAKVIQVLKTWTNNGMFRVIEGKDHKGTTRKFVEVGEWAGA
jgi:hypothetical protein